MATEKVSTSESNAEGARKLDVDFNFGEDLDNAADLFGDEPVYNLYLRGARIAVNQFVSDQMKAGKTDEEILSLVTEFKPGTKAPRQAATSVEKLMKAFTKMTAEDKARILASLKTGA